MNDLISIALCVLALGLLLYMLGIGFNFVQRHNKDMQRRHKEMLKGLNNTYELYLKICPNPVTKDMFTFNHYRDAKNIKAMACEVNVYGFGSPPCAKGDNPKVK